MNEEAADIETNKAGECDKEVSKKLKQGRVYRRPHGRPDRSLIRKQRRGRGRSRS